MNKSLFLLKNNYDSFSISPENPTGKKGSGGMANIPDSEKETHPARELGQTFKIRPFIIIKKGETVTLGEYSGEGIINHIWMTNTDVGSNKLVLRIYFDNSSYPSIDCPVSDFFFNGNNTVKYIDSCFISVCPGKGYNSYWQMPFKKQFKATITNYYEYDIILYYQIDFTCQPVDEKAGYFHALFKRKKKLELKKDYIILDKVSGKGVYVGTQLSYGSKYPGWWGEGEVKVFIDGDDKFPTYCGTGTEDYFGGAWNFEEFVNHTYVDFSHLYSGFHQTHQNPIPRFSMYRIHNLDAIYFKKDIKVTVQSIGWKPNIQPMLFNVQDDDLSSVAYFYLDRPLEHNQLFKAEDLDY